MICKLPGQQCLTYHASRYDIPHLGRLHVGYHNHQAILHGLNWYKLDQTRHHLCMRTDAKLKTTILISCCVEDGGYQCLSENLTFRHLPFSIGTAWSTS